MGADRTMEGINQIAAAALGGNVRTRGVPRANWVDRNFPRLAVLPTALLMLLVFGVPLLFSAWLSLEAWSPDQTLFGGKFAGTANYEDLLTDPEFVGSLALTLAYTAGVVSRNWSLGWASRCC